MAKRDIFGELQEGMEAWAAFESGKKILKTHSVKLKTPSLTAAELKSVRVKLNLSQAVFAQFLHTGVTTYQNWEQGLAKPNKQAILLIKMVDKNPATLLELVAISS